MERSTLPVLYTFRRCPYAIRARMALQHADIVYERREVKLSNKPQAMLDISSKGTVPILQLDNGLVLDESLNIMRWALAQNNRPTWLQADDANLISKNDLDFKVWLDRYKYPARHPEHSNIESRKYALIFIQQLEERLADNTYLYSDSISLADIAVFPFVRQFAKVDYEWFINSTYVGVVKWLQKFETSSLFLNVMIKVPLWSS